MKSSGFEKFKKMVETHGYLKFYPPVDKPKSKCFKVYLKPGASVFEVNDILNTIYNLDLVDHVDEVDNFMEHVKEATHRMNQTLRSTKGLRQWK